MDKEKLQDAMSAKGITMTELAARTKIPMSTLRRIVSGSVTRVKEANMHAIARALNMSVEALFDVPSQYTVQPIRPEEAGEPGMRNISADESFLLYWYQNVSSVDRSEIYEFARNKYSKTLSVLSDKANGRQTFHKEKDRFEQMSLFPEKDRTSE